MIVFIQADGTAVKIMPTPVYQGSSLSGSLYLVAPYPPTNSVSVSFTLPNGDCTANYALAPQDWERMTSFGVIPGLTDGEQNSYTIWQWQTKNGSITATPGRVQAQFKIMYNGEIQTTTSINFDVLRGVLPLPPEEPTPDQWDALLELYGELSGRVTWLEKREGQVSKVLIDFTLNDLTGEGIKYFSDGTTETFYFPISSEPDDLIRINNMQVLTFYVGDETDPESAPGSWIRDGVNGYICAFKTQFTNAEFITALESNGNATYKAGTQTTDETRTGYYTSVDSVFKGNDGSVLLRTNEPYSGRLLCLGGIATSKGNVVKNIEITNNGDFKITYLNEEQETLIAPWLTEAEVNGKISDALQWAIIR